MPGRLALARQEDWYFEATSDSRRKVWIQDFDFQVESILDNYPWVPKRGRHVAPSSTTEMDMMLPCFESGWGRGLGSAVQRWPYRTIAVFTSPKNKETTGQGTGLDRTQTAVQWGTEQTRDTGPSQCPEAISNPKSPSWNRVQAEFHLTGYAFRTESYRAKSP